MSSEAAATRSWRAKRLELLPKYLFFEIARLKREAVAAGRDVIDLGVGDPDQPTPRFIVDAMAEAIRDPLTHQYPFRIGPREFNEAAVEYISRRFGVEVDPVTETIDLIGSKEGLAHLPLAVVNPGDTVIVPQPSYPVYESSTIFAGGVPFILRLTEANNWLPDWDDIPHNVRKAARLIFLNYPNNPTAACAPYSFYEEAVAFAREHDLLIAHDAAYADLYFDDPPPSILQVPGAKDVAVELHSLSKTFNMTGWRIGFAVGNASAVGALSQVKSNVDSGQFHAVRRAGAAALRNVDHPQLANRAEVYRGRRAVVVEGLQRMGISAAEPRASFYVWARCPEGYSSLEFAARILRDAAVVVIPGVGFGAAGENYFRIALTVDDERTQQAMERMVEVKL